MESSKQLNPFVVKVVLLVVILTLFIVSHYTAEGQIISSSCSSSATTFTPCLNYITGSSANGVPPTAQCCDAVKSIMADSVECACLIINGNVPFSIPFSRPLALSLPRVCKTGVPLRCRASGVPLPAPGPVIFGSTPAPSAHSPIGQKGPVIFGPTPAPSAHSPVGQKDSKATSAAAPPPLTASPDETIAPAASPDQMAPAASPPHAVSLGPVANPGIRPVINPNSSASNAPHVRPPFLLLTLLLGFMLLKCI